MKRKYHYPHFLRCFSLMKNIFLQSFIFCDSHVRKHFVEIYFREVNKAKEFA